MGIVFGKSKADNVRVLTIKVIFLNDFKLNYIFTNCSRFATKLHKIYRGNFKCVTSVYINQ